MRKASPERRGGFVEDEDGEVTSKNFFKKNKKSCKKVLTNEKRCYIIANVE